MSIKFDLFRQADTAGQGREMIPVTALRAEIKSRLQEAYTRLDPRTVFNRQAGASKPDSMFGGMLLGALGFGGLAAGLDLDAGLDIDGFGADEQALALKALDIAVDLRDEEAESKKARVIRLDDYPEGRRKAFFHEESKKTAKAFNLVSGNDNARFDLDATAEVAAMTEMLMVLDKMEKQNVKHLRLEPRADVYAALRRCA